MNDEIKALMEQFKEWIPFVQSLRGISEKAWDASLEPGKWCVKDIVSHIMMWDKYFYEEAITKIASDQTVALELSNFEDFNRQAASYGKTLTTDELLDQAIEYREKIAATIENLPDSALAKDYPGTDGNAFQFSSYLKDFIWHDQHHMAQIKELV